MSMEEITKNPLGQKMLNPAPAFAREPGTHLDFALLRAANALRQLEIDPKGLSMNAGFRCMELGGEVGEAMNVAKKLEREKLGISGSRDTVEHLEEEIADAIICLDLLALLYGIDVGAAVRKKWNRTSEERGINLFIR